MLKSFGLFISLLLLLLSLIAVFNSRWVVNIIVNSKDLENNIVGKVKVLSGLVSIISLYLVAILIK